MGRLWPIAVVVTALLLLAPGEAAARCNRRASARLLAEGKKFFQLARYDDAIERWERAYLECDDPVHIYNLAQAHRKAGHVEQAIVLYQRWLQLSPKAPAYERADVEKQISELELKRPPPVELPVAPICEDGSTSPECPPDPRAVAVEPPAVMPPPPQPAVVVARPPVRPQPIDRTARWYQDRWGWALVGTGIALTGLGVGLLERGGGESGLDDQTDRFTLGGAVSAAIGLSVLGSGIVKLVLTDPAAPGRSEIACGLGWCGVRGVF